MCSKNSAFLGGHRPCVHPYCLAWACLPTSPLYRLNGTYCFCKVTEASGDYWDVLTLDGLGSFTSVLKVNMKI